ncbi:hypothetical protein ACQWHJ_25000, partial [Salmonella enterica subsp. enterica serovar Infantis]
TNILPTESATCRTEKAFTPPSGKDLIPLTLTLTHPPSNQQRATHPQQADIAAEIQAARRTKHQGNRQLQRDNLLET